MAPVHREDDHYEVAPTWDDLVERKIRAARERGDFDDLPGRGRPLRLEDNPYAGDWQLAYKILRDHGFAPPWVEASRELERRLEAVCQAASGWGSGDRAAARRAFLEQVRTANAAIARFNLLTPFAWLQRPPLSADAEALRFDAAWPP